MAVGCIAPLRESLRHGSFSWLGLTLTSLGSSGVVLGTIILGGSLWRASRQRPAAAASAASQSGLERGGHGQPDVALESTDLASDAGGARDAALPGGSGRPRPWALVSAAVLLRLVVLPLVAMPLNSLAVSAGLLPDEPMLLLLLHIMAGTPSSQTLVTMLLARGQVDLAAEVSQVYVPQYLASVLTIAAVIVAGIVQIGPGP